MSLFLLPPPAVTGLSGLSGLPMSGSGGGSPPTPFDPTTFTGFVGDRDANNATTRWLNAGGTGAATTDGDLIAALGDANGGTGGLWPQATGAAKPVLKLAIVNGRDVFRFAGGQRLGPGSTPYSFAGDFSIYLALRMDTLVSTMILSGASNRQIIVGDGGLNKLSAYAAGANQAISSTLGTAANNWLTVAWIRRSGTCFFFENGTARGSGLLDGTMTVRNLGCSDGAGSFLTGDFGRACFYSSGHDDATVASFFAGFKALFGL